MLRDHGTQVDTASNGREAIDALEKTPYTLVATDIRMPDVSGIELLQHVKEHYPDTEVILITGYASTSSAIEALRLGAYDYIEKPFEMLEFLQTI
ncbi:MAG: response regulator, partial [Candidatus Latescibacteria bacterium]|nr:response regulator [Candidatus Latescibacterota bacterium]